jgi:ribonucleoside-diphosphate reductase alpha chain
MSLKTLENVSYFRLNNEINIPVNGQIPLHRITRLYLPFSKKNVRPNLKTFPTVAEKSPIY